MLWSGGLSREEVPLNLPAPSQTLQVFGLYPVPAAGFALQKIPVQIFPPPDPDELPDLPQYVFIL